MPRLSRHLLSALAPLLTLGAVSLGVLIAHSAPVRSATPQVLITPNSALNFGSFMVFGSGSRTVSASGAVSDLGIIPVEGSAAQLPRPAQFTVGYDRGNESNQRLTIVIDVVISAPPAVQLGGVQGTLTAIQTDLPGAGGATAGQPIRVTISACRTRVCSHTFQVGGRLNVTRSSGGGTLSIPIPVDARIVSVDRV